MLSALGKSKESLAALEDSYALATQAVPTGSSLSRRRPAATRPHYV